MAEAPSCNTSIREITFSGIVFRSTALGTPDAEAPAIQRRPSTSISVRLAPTFRIASCAAPAPMPDPSCGNPELPGTLNCELMAEPLIGSCCSALPRLTRPVFSMASALMSMIATGSSSGLRRIRDPVTITSSISSASCANVSFAGMNAKPTTSAVDTAPATPLYFFIMNPRFDESIGGKKTTK